MLSLVMMLMSSLPVHPSPLKKSWCLSGIREPIGTYGHSKVDDLQDGRTFVQMTRMGKAFSAEQQPHKAAEIEPK